MIYVPSNNAATHKEWHCEKCTNGLTGVSENLLEKIKFCPFCGTAVIKQNQLVKIRPYNYNDFQKVATTFKNTGKTVWMEKKENDNIFFAMCSIDSVGVDGISILTVANPTYIMLSYHTYGLKWRIWPNAVTSEYRKMVSWNDSNPFNSVTTAPPLTKKEYS